MAKIPKTKQAAVITEEDLEFIKTRMPIMPKDRRPRTAKSGENRDLNGSYAPPPTQIKSIIKIARPEMSLTGFAHTQKNIDKKARLMESKVDDQLAEIHSATSRRSIRTRSRMSGSKVQEPEDDEDDISEPESRGLSDFDASAQESAEA